MGCLNVENLCSKGPKLQVCENGFYIRLAQHLLRRGKKKARFRSAAATSGTIRSHSHRLLCASSTGFSLFLDIQLSEHTTICKNGSVLGRNKGKYVASSEAQHSSYSLFSNRNVFPRSLISQGSPYTSMDFFP